ncbi:MAG TPA: bacterioferritin [Kiloniellales bacterium]|nr:bacterioferritin [Kiloniellales bacterium]
MQGDAGVLERLNRVLYNELTAINQYFLHARMLRNWGYAHLAKAEYEESIDEMKHADRLVERILFLDGLPNLQDLGRLRIAENVPELLAADLATEMEAMPVLREAIAYCEKVKDFISRELLEDILESEEDHVNFLETQQSMLKAMGLENYLQLQSRPAEEDK